MPQELDIIAELTPIIKEGVLSSPDRPPNTPINEQDIPQIIHTCYTAFTMNLLEDIVTGNSDGAIYQILNMAAALTKHNEHNN